MNKLQKLLMSPAGVMMSAIGVTVTIIGGYKFVIKPELDRRKRQQAEEFANFLFNKTNAQNQE